MTLDNHTTMRLKPVLSLFHYCCSFPTQEGDYDCEIYAEHGNIRFQHKSYNLQTGCWDQNPDGQEPDELVIHEGERKKFHFCCRVHDGQKDEILVSNASFLKPADFTCSFTRTAPAPFRQDSSARRETLRRCPQRAFA